MELSVEVVRRRDDFGWTFTGSAVEDPRTRSPRVLTCPPTWTPFLLPGIRRGGKSL